MIPFLHTLTTILVCRIKSLSFKFEKNVYEAVTTLNTLDTDLLGSLVKMVHKCPDTAVTLQCELLTDYMKAHISFLCDEWQKTGGNVKFASLCIHFYLLDDKTNMLYTFSVIA